MGAYGDLLEEGMRVPGLEFVKEDRINSGNLQGLVRAVTKLAERLQVDTSDASAGMFLT